MGIDKLHIEQEEYNFFTTLDDKEKIEFLHDAQSIGVGSSISKRIEGQFEDEELVNDLFQDTMYEEMLSNIGRMIILTMNNYIHLNSSSLVLIRKFVNKLLDDGHIIMRVKNAKKLPGVDNLRFYRCYEIIGTGHPFCPN